MAGLGSHFWEFFASTPSLWRELEEAGMFEAILGLIVALCLCVYLVITLLMPERF
jgi:K+-transporting ATPase KdpF subunit